MSERQATKNATRSASDIVQAIAAKEPEAKLAHEALVAANQAVNDYRESHPELAILEEEANEAFQAFIEKLQPLQHDLSALSQVDPQRFSSELKRINSQMPGAKS